MRTSYIVLVVCYALVIILISLLLWQFYYVLDLSQEYLEIIKAQNEALDRAAEFIRELQSKIETYERILEGRIRVEVEIKEEVYR